MLKRFVTWLYKKVCKQEPIVEQVKVVRLSEDQIIEVSKTLANPVVSNTTSELEAGYKLGVQQTLAVLRKGFVDGRL